MADQRTYQGHVYEQSAPGQPWVLVGPAPSGPQAVTIGTPDPNRADAPKRAADADARAAAAAKRTELEWNATHNPDGSPKSVDGALTPEAITFNAQQYLTTGQMPTLGMGKQAAADREAILNEAAKQAGAGGLKGEDLARQIAHYKAGSKQLAQLETQLGTIRSNEQAALSNGKLFLDLSAQAPGQTSIPLLNSAIQGVARHTGDPEVSGMDAAWQTFTTEYAKVIAGSPNGSGTLSDSARQEAQNMVRGNYAPAQKQAALAAMQQDMENRIAAIHGSINEGYANLTQKPGYAVPDATNALPVPGKQQDPETGAVISGASPGGTGNTGNGSPGGNTGGGAPPPSFPGSSFNGGGVPIPGTGPVAGTGADVPQAPATSATRAVDHPEIRALVASMVNAGSDLGTINAALSRRGFPQVTPQQFTAAQKWMGQHPGVQYPASSIDANTYEPLTLMQRAVDSPLAAFGVQATNSFDAGLPGLFTGERGRGTLEAMQAADPTASALGELAGTTAGMASAGAGAAKLAEKVAAPTVARLLAKPLLADTAFGTVSGATQSQDPYEGAVIGGLTAGLGGLGGRAVAKVVPRMFGVTPPPDALTGGERAVYDAANKTGIPTIQEALAQADQLGVPASLADVSPPVNALAGSALRNSPDAMGNARTALAARSRGQIDRFTGAVERDLGPVTNIPQRSEDLIAKAKAEAAPLYDKAYAAPGAEDVNLADLQDRPTFSAALRDAYNQVLDENIDPSAIGLQQVGDNIKVASPSWQTLDYVKRGLDNIIERDTSKIDGVGPEGRRAIEMKNLLLSRMDKANPDYAAARAAYAGPASERSAMQAGQDAISLNPDQLGVNVANATPSQADQMRLGFQSGLVGKANNVRDTTNPFETLLAAPAMRDRLGTLYPEDNVAKLLSQRDLEQQLAASHAGLTGNSATMERGAADAAFQQQPSLPAILAQGAAETAITGAPVVTVAQSLARGGVRSSFGKWGQQRAQQAATDLADQVAPIALDMRPAASSSMLDDMAARDAQYKAVMDALLQKAANRGGHAGAGVSSGAADALMR